MSCSCCCCVTPRRELLLQEGCRRKREEEEEEAGGREGEDSRRNMDISLLRQQYRSTTETQRRHTQVLLFRRVSQELSDAINVVPVMQGLTSPPAITFEPDPTAYDPWHVHLGLHRRCCAGVSMQLTASSPETTNTNSSSRWSSSSSEPGSSQLDLDSTLDPSSPCSPSSCTKEEEEHLSVDGFPEQTDPVQVSVSGSLDPGEESTEDHPDASFSSSDESSTPVASTLTSPRSSASSLHADLKNQNKSAAGQTSNGVLQSSCSSAWRGSRQFSAPALRFTRQFSVGGLGSSAGVHQNHDYHPFPSRKTPRISEAARRLGMYSSF